MATEYPASVYDQGYKLLMNLGSFWHKIFGDNAELEALYTGEMTEAGQTYRNYIETMATISRLDIPVFHKDNWYFLEVLESEIDTDTVKYGSGETYGNGTVYGERTASVVYTAPVPSNLKRVRSVYNRLVLPTVSLSEGLDYSIDTESHLIEFKDNPFDNPLFSVSNVVDETGEVSDRVIGMWLYSAEFDLNYVWQHFGYVLGLYMESSEYYKTFVNAMFDAFIDTPALASIQDMLSALTGIPIVIEQTEVIEQILRTDSKLQIITDLNVYTFEPTAVVKPDIQAAYDAGIATVYGGDSLVTSLEIVEVFQDTVDVSTLPAISLGNNLITGDYYGELTFENKYVDLEYLGEDEDGKVMVTFEVSGYDEDVAAFWAAAHSAGKAGGSVLADYLDKRTVKNGPPLPAHLPSTVNPLNFIFNNLLGNNTLIVKMRPIDFPANAPGTKFMRALRRVLPPHVILVVYVELSPPNEYINMSTGSDDVTLLDVSAPAESFNMSLLCSETVILTEIGDCT